jgi:hypothetical protein
MEACLCLCQCLASSHAYVKVQREAVGLSAVMPQKAAGMRTEPPTSEPIPNGEALALSKTRQDETRQKTPAGIAHRPRARSGTSVREVGILVGVTTSQCWERSA